MSLVVVVAAAAAADADAKRLHVWRKHESKSRTGEEEEEEEGEIDKKGKKEDLRQISMPFCLFSLLASSTSLHLSHLFMSLCYSCCSQESAVAVAPLASSVNTASLQMPASREIPTDPLLFSADPLLIHAFASHSSSSLVPHPSSLFSLHSKGTADMAWQALGRETAPCMRLLLSYFG